MNTENLIGFIAGAIITSIIWAIVLLNIIKSDSSNQINQPVESEITVDSITISTDDGMKLDIGGETDVR